jgi:hypothetical protein
MQMPLCTQSNEMGTFGAAVLVILLKVIPLMVIMPQLLVHLMVSFRQLKSSSTKKNGRHIFINKVVDIFKNEVTLIYMSAKPVEWLSEANSIFSIQV